MFHKPKGCITARSDPRHKTVMDYFPIDMRDTFFPIGRLDKDTEGLLFVTDDGPLCYHLMLPEHKVKKSYFFWAKGEMSDEKKLALEEGAAIFPGKPDVTKPARLELLEKKSLIDIRHLISEDEEKTARRRPDLPVFSGVLTITEGKKHQVKRMLKFAGCKIVYLKRLSIGAISLDENLEAGEYRELSANEISSLKE